jgi:hypothetical protein
VIGSDELALFHDLRALRNQAAHEHEEALGPESAVRYVDLAQSFVRAVERRSGGDGTEEAVQP